MTKRMISVRRLDDITECPICTESYNDPRSLPCIHTFCFTCISKWVGDKPPGANVNCPLCRKGFTLPANGLEELPKNIFIGKLLSMIDVSSSVSDAPLCDWCAAKSNTPTENKKEAKHYCADCDKNLCQDCAGMHSKLRRRSSHRMHTIAGRVRDVSAVILPTRCDKHPNEDLKLFCKKCEDALCLLCFATKHTGHESTEVELVADGFREEIKGNVLQLACGVGHLTDSLSFYQSKREDILSQFDEIEAEICSRAELLKSTIECNKRQLISELAQLKTEKLKDLDTMVSDITQNKSLMGSLMKYSEELLKKGSNGDVAREIKLLNLRFAEMKQFYDIKMETTRDRLAIFVPSVTTLDTSSNAVGRLERTADNGPCPTLCFTYLGKTSVDAVTSFNNQLFVVRCDNTQIEVYDGSSFKLLRLIKLPVDVGALNEGLAVCSVNDCLYVSDFVNNKVLKIILSASDSSKTTKWSVARGPQGLSVNRSHNLLVACFGAHKVQEYTSTGELVREIGNVAGVRHAVELQDGTLVVSQAQNAVNLVSIVSLDGKVLRRYPPVTATTPGTKQMKDPRTLAVDKNGFIFVADRDNNRILVVNPELTDARPLPLILDTLLERPLGLRFEESRGRLYVGEDGGKQRVLAFDNVFNVHTLFKR